MSLVVAVRDKDRIVFGSDKQASTGFNKSHDTTKIWSVQDLPGAIMGGVGSLRASQIIQYNKLVDLNDVAEHNGIDTDFIINSLVPVIVGQLQAHGIVCETSEDKETPCTMIPNVFLFAIEDKAWMIWHDLSVTELDDYLVIGSGSDVATGALFATPDKNPFERIVTCIDAAAESTLYVDDGVDLLATKYYNKDAKLIAKALGVTVANIADLENSLVEEIKVETPVPTETDAAANKVNHNASTKTATAAAEVKPTKKKNKNKSRTKSED